MATSPDSVSVAMFVSYFRLNLISLNKLITRTKKKEGKERKERKEKREEKE